MFDLISLTLLSTFRNHMRTQKSKELCLNFFQKENFISTESMLIKLSRCLDLGKTMARVTVDVELDGDDA